MVILLMNDDCFFWPGLHYPIIIHELEILSLTKQYGEMTVCLNIAQSMNNSGLATIIRNILCVELVTGVPSGNQTWQLKTPSLLMFFPFKPQFIGDFQPPMFDYQRIL
jgi:hypothetical protein